MRTQNVAATVASAAAMLLAVTAACGPGSRGARSAGSSQATRLAGGGPQQATLYPQYMLTGVSCASPAACTAVGEIANVHPVNPAPAVLRWNGRAWSLQHAPNPPAHGGSTLTAVSCSRPDDCIAVGARGGYQEGTLAERWNGKTWSVQPTPLSHTISQLSGVSCFSPTACTAVGDQVLSRGARLVSVAMRWNGKTWARQSTPNSPGAVTTLVSVSCPTATACMAIGSNELPVGSAALAEHWNGQVWTLQPVPKPAGGPGRMRSVACASATYCVAVGNSDANQGQGRQQPVSVVWNGSTWKQAPVPYPPQSFEAELFGVSCRAPTACTAVGTYAPYGKASQTMADRWNGTSWTRQPSATPPGFSIAYMSSVSCPASRACIAAGVKGPPPHTLAERWNGSAWTLTPTP